MTARPVVRNSRRTEPRTPTKVSVLIPTLNAVGTIGVQLDALAAQDYPGPFEVTVCDNGSADGLAEYLASHPLRDELSLRLIDASQRPGAAAARNIGAAATDGDLLVFCDADDAAHPQWLSSLVDTAQWYDMVSGSLESVTLNSPEVRSWRPVDAPEKPHVLTGFLPVVIGGNLAVWSDAYQQAEGCSEAYRWGFEDADFAIRAQLNGLTVGHSPEALLGYRLRDTLRGLFDQSMTYGFGNVQLYADHRRHGMPRRPLIALIDVILYLLIRNPLLPEFITRVPTGRWLFQAGHLVGRVRGSLHFRCWYI